MHRSHDPFIVSEGLRGACEAPDQNRFGTSRRGATQAPAAISPPTIATAVRPAVMVRSFPVQRPRADQGAGTFS